MNARENPGLVPRIGLFGFGQAGRAVATVLLNARETRLEWVVRRCLNTECRSVPEFLGVKSDEPGIIISIQAQEFWTLFWNHPVDIVVDFSSETGLDKYLSAAF